MSPVQIAPAIDPGPRPVLSAVLMLLIGLTGAVVMLTGRVSEGSTGGPCLASPMLQAPQFNGAATVELVVRWCSPSWSSRTVRGWRC